MQNFLNPKTDTTIIGPKTDTTNSNVIDVGTYPLRGNVPESSNFVSCSTQDLIYLNPKIFYQYFNATKDWQKKHIDNKISLYQNTLSEYVVQKYHYTLGTNLVQIAHDDFVKKVGQQSIYGTQTRKNFVHVVMDIQPQYELVVEGNNLTEKVSLMKPNFNIQKLIKLKDGKELLLQMYGNVDITDTKLVDITPIDMNSLRAYIKGNENLSYQNDKVREYNLQANNILLIAELTNGVFPQIINESTYGRRYYTGQNLQTMSSIVRSAALGSHYQYDLNAAVYAIKLNLCAYMSDKKFTYTSEYIEGGSKYKDKIRERLAKITFETDEPIEWQISVVKRAITAIGFGATMHSKGFYDQNDTWNYNSIADLFRYKSKTTDKWVLAEKTYQRFVNDEWLKHFMREQKEMTDIITKWYIENDMVNKIEHSFLVDGRNAFNKNKLMAYIFQTFERGIMDKTEQFTKDTGNEVLLRVHDAIYTRKRINMLELHVMLNREFQSNKLNWLGNKVISFTETYQEGYYYDDELTQHKEHIKQEEILAKGYYVEPKKVKHNYRPQIEGFYDGGTDYGDRHYYREQENELPDFITKLV